MRVCNQCGEIENDAAARYCRGCGSLLSSEPRDVEISGTVSVLRCDVVGSSSLFERHEPELVRRILTTYLEIARHTVGRYGGTIERVVGDAFMAVFGSSEPREDDAFRAVRAAVELRGRLSELSGQLRSDRIDLAVRTVVATGEIAAEEKEPGQPRMTGAVTSAVARLGESAVPGEILLDEQTVRLLRQQVEVESVEPPTRGGATLPVTAYRLLALVTGDSAHARRPEMRLIGRGAELQVLRALQALTVQARTCHLVTVFGAAGIGKSRLVEEFLRQVGSQPLVLRGRCLSYGGVAYSPITQVIAQAASIDLAKRDHLGERLAALVGEEAQASRIVERLEQILDRHNGRAGLPEDTHWALRRLLEILAARQPLVIVLDDLQWAEPNLLDLVEDLAESLHNVPLLLVCLARTEMLDKRRRWAGGKVSATSIPLAPLAQDEVEQLVTGLLGDIPATSDVLAYITELAGGNPLFARSLVAMLREGGSLRLSDDGREWLAAEYLAKLDIPPDMQAVLQARIVSLRPEERRAIERAALIGRQFSVDALIELSEPDDRPSVRGSLRALAREELIVPSGGAVLIQLGREDAYSFSHSPVREAAYQGIPWQDRADLHERYAGWLRTIAADDPPRVDELVGHHFEQAHQNLLEVGLGRGDERVRRLARQAGEALAAAGHRAAARGDIPAAAVSLLKRAVRLLDHNDAVRRGALLDLADALSAAGEPTEAIRIYREVAAVAEQAEDFGLASHAKLGLLEVEWFNGFKKMAGESVAEVEHARQVFDWHRDNRGLARACLLQAHAHWALGHLRQAREASVQAIELARWVADERLEASGVSTCCSVLLAGPWPVDEVDRDCEQALEWARARGIRSLEADALRILAQTAAMQGRFDDARELLRRAGEFRTRRGGELDEAPDTAMYPSGLLGWVADTTSAGRVMLLAGDPAGAERELRRGYRQLDRISGRALLAGVAALLARALLDQGNEDEAEQVSRDCDELSSEGQLDSQVRWRAVRAVLLARKGRLGQAERLVREAISLAGQSEQTESRAEVLGDLAEVLRRAGRGGEAAVAATRAADLYEDKGNLVAARGMRRLVEQTLGVVEDLAHDHRFRQARIVAEAIEVIWHEAMLDASQLATALGEKPANRERARVAREQSALLGLGSDPDFVYPAFQIDDARQEIRPVVQKVNQLLGATADPWGVASWWTTRNALLQARPMDLLDTDRENELILAAQASFEPIG